MRSRFAQVAFALMVACLQPALAQQGGTDGGNGGTAGGTDGGNAGGEGGQASEEGARLGTAASSGAMFVGTGIAPPPAGAASRTIVNGGALCKRLPATYRLDCYRLVLLQAAGQLAGQPGYAEAQRALDTAAGKIDRIVQANLDPAAAPARVGSARARAVRPDAVDRTARQAETVLDEARTTLLRSSDKSRVHYTRIAAAVGSMKVLLRSAAVWIGTGTEAIRHA